MSNCFNETGIFILEGKHRDKNNQNNVSFGVIICVNENENMHFPLIFANTANIRHIILRITV